MIDLTSTIDAIGRLVVTLQQNRVGGVMLLIALTVLSGRTL